MTPERGALLAASAVTAAEAAEFRRLIEALDREGLDRRMVGVPGGCPPSLIDRVFETSLVDLRRSGAVTLTGAVGSSAVGAGAFDSAPESSQRRLNRTDAFAATRHEKQRSGAGRSGFARLARWGPSLAMAASIGLAFLVALPSMSPLLRGGPGPDSGMMAMRAPEADVEPVLAALLGDDSDGTWADVGVIRFSPELFQPISSRPGAAPPMATIVETQGTSFTDFAAEFARIRDASDRS